MEFLLGRRTGAPWLSMVAAPLLGETLSLLSDLKPVRKVTAASRAMLFACRTALSGAAGAVHWESGLVLVCAHPCDGCRLGLNQTCQWELSAS